MKGADIWANPKPMRTLIAGFVAGTLLFATNDTMAQATPKDPGTRPSAAMHDHDLQATIKGWPTKPKEQVMLMQKKYGEPQIVSEHMVAWKDSGPFMFTKIIDKELPHDFPVVHTDFMEQGVAYKVPAEKVGDLAMYDGSIIVDRTKGCLSARCDVEAHNMLALNLAHDVITGKRTPEAARMHFANVVAKEMKGEKDPYLEKLLFTPESGDTGDKDMPVKAMDMSKEGKR